MKKRLRAAVVGLSMGKTHALNCVALKENYELVALCDLSKTVLERTGEETGCKGLYEDYRQMLRQVKPEAVFIATPDFLHEEMVIQAAEAGVKGIYCEKPIAVSMNSVEKMRKACEDAGSLLVIGHMRRFSPHYQKIKRILEEGVLGRVECIKCYCAGDLLVDGTHLIDSILYLLDEPKVEWILGQVYRGRKATPEELSVNRFLYSGNRYGHPVEEGAIAAVKLEGNVQLELCTGTAVPPGKGYQDIEIIGDKGRLRKAGDEAVPELLLDEQLGWETLEIDEQEDKYGYLQSLQEFSNSIRLGTDHTMAIGHAVKGFEILMGIYESARLHKKLELPVLQKEFPLQLMLQNGQLE